MTRKDGLGWRRETGGRKNTKSKIIACKYAGHMQTVDTANFDVQLFGDFCQS